MKWVFPEEFCMCDFSIGHSEASTEPPEHALHFISIREKGFRWNEMKLPVEFRSVNEDVEG